MGSDPLMTAFTAQRRRDLQLASIKVSRIPRFPRSTRQPLFIFFSTKSTDPGANIGFLSNRFSRISVNTRQSIAMPQGVVNLFDGRQGFGIISPEDSQGPAEDDIPFTPNDILADEVHAG